MKEPPRTALVHDWLTGMRGGESVLQEIAALFPGAPIYTLFHFPGSVTGDLEAHPIHPSFLQKAPALRRHYRRYLPLFPAAIEEFDLSGYQRIISTSHCVAKGAIPAPGAVHVCYCFTPMRYVWDQQGVYFPRRSGLLARLRGALLSRLRTWDAASAARVDRFLAISRFVAARIRRYYGRDADVIPPPVDVGYFSPSDSGREGYALAVAALVPYKRLEVAIAACERAGLELRVVGEGPERGRLEARAGGRTRFLGRVERGELRELYRRAELLVQPGVEDFGIAAAEALACGTPVVALGRGGIRDIVTDGEHGVLFFEEGNPEALAAAIDKGRRIRFNKLNLRERAEPFSTEIFRARIRPALGLPDSGGA